MADPCIVDTNLEKKGLITYYCLKRKLSGSRNWIFFWLPAKLSSAIPYTARPPPARLSKQTHTKHTAVKG